MKQINFTIKLDSDHSTMTNYASHIVHEASQFASDMMLIIGDCRVDLKSILGVVSIGLYEGKNATITIEGFDEDKAYKRLKNLLSN